MMDKPVLFFAETCPDTAPFVARLQELGVQYEPIEIQSSLGNLKRFLALRDSRAEFEAVKARGSIGIPALLLNNDSLVLDADKLADVFK
ncbi:glutaredoxin-related protein [Avibacterium gallinarum]|uniref:Glutaredoxin-related protein n=2 Tax=Avibacterium gallinarum TaxID=755 RepID=A0A379AUY1_AVIGA|nr:glutaredoxin-related protein [Avibacterium gallinarum]SUB25780.1 Glutaredoxin-related protein [Avibacterium gallinarum]